MVVFLLFRIRICIGPNVNKAPQVSNQQLYIHFGKPTFRGCLLEAIWLGREPFRLSKTNPLLVSISQSGYHLKGENILQDSASSRNV